jgi:hypothetical protein
MTSQGNTETTVKHGKAMIYRFTINIKHLMEF